MTAQIQALLVRASRRRHVVRLHVGGGCTAVGTIGYVGVREVLVLDPKTLRPIRVWGDAIERVEIVR